MEKQTQTYAQLPPEILQLILTDYTNNLQDRRPIMHLLLVSRLLYSIYAPILYGSLYLTESDQSPVQKHTPSTILTRCRLSDLRVALSGSVGLSKAIHTFSIGDELEPRLTPSDWRTIKAIFACLTQLERLYVPPILGTPSSVLSSLPKTIQLTHLISGSRRFQSSLTPFLQTQRLLQYLSLFSPSFAGLPHLHTLHCDREAFPRIRSIEFPALEHIVLKTSIMMWPLSNEDIVRRLRTLNISCIPDDQFVSLLRDLERVEFLDIELICVTKIETYPLQALLDIPSKGLKYICLSSTQFYEDSVIAKRFLDAYPNLLIVDVRPARLEASGTEFIVDRISQPKVFESWWEMREIRGDVEAVRVDGTSYLIRNSPYSGERHLEDMGGWVCQRENEAQDTSK
ncbi:hypothetical protein ONZ45_g10342 [Pleurotus djamor]|nr:hypothetical protein ONZ45_g10342 [Pleurotus djamor]